MYFIFEMLRGRINFAHTMRFSGITSITVILSFFIGLLVSYAAAKGAGLDFQFLQPIKGNGASNIIMIVTSVLLCAIVIMIYLKGRADSVRSALTSMRSSAAYSAANKYALTTSYGTLVLHLVVGTVLLILVGRNELFFVPLACGTFALALWRATGLKFFFPIALYLIIFHALEILTAIAGELTIGVFSIMLANGVLDLILILGLTDLYITSKK